MWVLWGRSSSVNVQKVLWALDELGLPYKQIEAGGRFGIVTSDHFARMNPTRRVPVLQDGELTLWESEAILRYLSAQTGQLMPHDPAARAVADQWLAFGATGLQPHFITLFWQRVRLPAAQRDPVADAAARVSLHKALEVMAGSLAQQEWLAGQDFGLPDIALGALIYRIKALDLLPSGHNGLDRWVAALHARPAWQRRIATSFEDLRAPAP